MAPPADVGSGFVRLPSLDTPSEPRTLGSDSGAPGGVLSARQSSILARGSRTGMDRGRVGQFEQTRAAQRAAFPNKDHLIRAPRFRHRRCGQRRLWSARNRDNPCTAVSAAMAFEAGCEFFEWRNKSERAEPGGECVSVDGERSGASAAANRRVRLEPGEVDQRAGRLVSHENRYRTRPRSWTAACRSSSGPARSVERPYLCRRDGAVRVFLRFRSRRRGVCSLAVERCVGAVSRSNVSVGSQSISMDGSGMGTAIPSCQRCWPLTGAASWIAN